MTQREIEALAELRDSPVESYLTAKLHKVFDIMVHCKDEITLRHLQGQSQMLRDLIDEIHEADEKLAGRAASPPPVENRHKF